MKILAFLQNPWFRPGISQRHVKMYRENQKFHRKVLAMSATGRALIRAFGTELYGKIIWENANPCHGSDRRSVMPPDVAHIKNVIAVHMPYLIICFGRQAQKGMKLLAGWPNIPDLLPAKCGSADVLYAPHPMAHGSAAEHLRKIVEEVRKYEKRNYCGR